MLYERICVTSFQQLCLYAMNMVSTCVYTRMILHSRFSAYPRIVTNEEDIAWFLNAVDNPHNGLTFCAGSLSAGAHNDTRELAKKFAGRTHFVHLRSTEAMPGGNFIESSHLSGRGTSD